MGFKDQTKTKQIPKYMPEFHKRQNILPPEQIVPKLIIKANPVLPKYSPPMQLKRRAACLNMPGSLRKTTTNTPI